MQVRGRRNRPGSSVPPPAERLATEGLVIAGRYELTKQIGRGGMSSIWVARDAHSSASVAVKVMVKPDNARDDVVERFRREAAVAKRLRGPHFCAVLDYGEHEGTPYMVMQLLEGENLQERLATRQRLELDEMRVMLADLAEGLRVAHEDGVVHRDLKPANLFFAKLPERLRSSRQEIVKILDFGIARSDAFSARLTAAGAIVGSLFYMSPEQARAQAVVDARSDLWQVGAVLYRCATGRRPFEGSPGAVLHRLAREDVAPPSSLDPDLPRALDPFFARALARTPDARFQTIEELADSFFEATRNVSGTRLAIRPRLDTPAAEDLAAIGGLVGSAPPIALAEEPPPAPAPRPVRAAAPEPEQATVVYSAGRASDSSARGSAPPGGAVAPTPATIPAFFSRDRLASTRPSPWIKAQPPRRGWLAGGWSGGDWLVAVVLLATALGLATILALALMSA